MYHELLQPDLQNGAIMSGTVYRAILCIICECSCLEESVKEGDGKQVLVSCPVYL